MNWEWVVPVIVLVVWILTHVIRPAEEQPPPKDARQRPLGDEPPQRPTSEVDRFLEEINRMRRKAAEERRPAPVAQHAPRPRPAPTRPATPRQPAEDIPSVLPVHEPVRPRRKTAVPPVLPAVEAVPVAAATAAPQPTSAARPSPALNLQALLQSPNAIRTAILLQEVLGPPRCQRPLFRR